MRPNIVLRACLGALVMPRRRLWVVFAWVTRYVAGLGGWSWSIEWFIARLGFWTRLGPQRVVVPLTSAFLPSSLVSTTLIDADLLLAAAVSCSLDKLQSYHQCEARRR